MSNRPLSTFFRYQLLGIIAAIAVNLTLMAVPVHAVDRAAVVVDGRSLFEVAGAESLTATERADLLNLRLQQIQRSSKPVQISIESRNQSPIILVNKQQLLTVTQSDVKGDRTPAEQAPIWAEQLTQALQQAQQEKSKDFLKNALLLTTGTLAMAIALHQGLGWLWRSIQQAVQRSIQSPSSATTDTDSPKALNLLFNLTLIAARIGLWIGTTVYITNLFPLSRSWSYALTSSLTASFTSPIVTIGRSSYSPEFDEA